MMICSDVVNVDFHMEENFSGVFIFMQWQYQTRCRFLKYMDRHSEIRVSTLSFMKVFVIIAVV